LAAMEKMGEVVATDRWLKLGTVEGICTCSRRRLSDCYELGLLQKGRKN